MVINSLELNAKLMKRPSPWNAPVKDTQLLVELMLKPSKIFIYMLCEGLATATIEKDMFR